MNPNQLRHYGIKVEGYHVSDEPLHIMTDIKEFNAELKIKETTIFTGTFTPPEKEI